MQGQEVGTAALSDPLEGSGPSRAEAQAWIQADASLDLSAPFKITPLGESPPLSETRFPHLEIDVGNSFPELL